MLTYNLEQRNDEPKYYYIYKMIRRDIERGKTEKRRKNFHPREVWRNTSESV